MISNAQPIPPYLPSEPIELPADVSIEQGMSILKQLLQSNPLAVLITTPQLDEPGPQITFANKAFLQQSGYTLPEVIGQTPRLFQGDHTQRTTLDRLRDDLANGRVFQGEAVNYRKDGTSYSVRWSIVPVTISGTIVQYVSYQLALTRAQTSLDPIASMRFTSRDPFEAIFENADIGIAIVDRETRFIRANQVLCRFLDYPEEELIGQSALDFCADQESRPDTAEAIEAVFQGIIDLNTDYQMRRKDGQTVVLRGSCKVLLSDDGQQYLVWAVHDVTSKLALEQRLQLHELRLDLAIHGCGLGFWDYDCRTREVYFSPGWKRILGYADHEFPNATSEWESRIHRDDVARVQRALDDFLSGRTTEYRIEYRLRHRDGTDRLIDARGAAIRDSRLRAIRFAGTHTDVSDRKFLEDQLRQSQKLDAIGQLAGGIAHDFNNLLTVILGNLDLIKLPEGDRNRPLVASAMTASTRAAELTSKLLGYARRSTLSMHELAPGDILREVASLLKATIDPRITITTDLPSQLPTVRGDSNALLQTFLNMAINARDAMPNGGELRLSAQACVREPNDIPPDLSSLPGDYVRLSVIDTGIGMSESTKSRLFEPFFTTKPVGRGTGMGLAVAYGTIRQHGGWIEVSSEVKRGTRFDVFLPSTQPTRRVLVVDDEETIRSFVLYCLNQAGWNAVEADGGQSALHIISISQRPFDVILLDLNMPGDSGEGWFRSIRGQAPNAKIILISGGSFEDRWQLEADATLSKPFDRDRLVLTVDSIANKK